MTSPRRRAILDAADRLFGHYGTHKTTIGDIAREVGIGVGSVYLEFASKDDIVLELARDRHQRIVSAMRNAARRGDAIDAVAAALEARVRVLFDLAADGAHACDLVACGATRTEKAAPRLAPRFSEEEHACLVALLAAARDAGAPGVDDAEAVALVVERAYATLSPPFVFCESMDEALGAAAALNRLLLVGLGAQPRDKTRRRRTRKKAGAR